MQLWVGGLRGVNGAKRSGENAQNRTKNSFFFLLIHKNLSIHKKKLKSTHTITSTFNYSTGK